MTHAHIFLLISKAKAVSTFSKAVHERRGQISGAKRSAAPDSWPQAAVFAAAPGHSLKRALSTPPRRPGGRPG